MTELRDTDQGQFEPTRWSLILRSRGADSSARVHALEALCRAYWYPLYAFLRRAGRSTEDAQDLVQDFFLRLMDGRLLSVAEPAKGKFRTLLLAALKRLDADAHKAMQTIRWCLRNSPGKFRLMKAPGGAGVVAGAMFNKLTRSLNLALLGRASSFSKK